MDVTKARHGPDCIISLKFESGAFPCLPAGVLPAPAPGPFAVSGSSGSDVIVFREIVIRARERNIREQSSRDFCELFSRALLIES